VLLQQIATANDALREASAPTSPAASPPQSPTKSSKLSLHSSGSGVSSSESPTPAPNPEVWASLTSASRTALQTHVTPLSFHARNIPSISIEAYLLRILKYCPTTNEVFLSLLVYFDRMSKMAADTFGGRFAIDSYNVHRLVIAGVTVASKFFSDVFYTNSRYAKVGGLPQAELNQLELQFLLLNDFRLVIPVEEMQRYADQLFLYSTSHASPPTPTSAINPVTPPTVPMPVDAPRSAPETAAAVATTPVARYQQLVDPADILHPMLPQPPRGEDAGAETETETEATETEDGYGTTDDEPTIRAAHSSASSSSDTRSIETGSTTTPVSESPRYGTVWESREREQLEGLSQHVAGIGRGRPTSRPRRVSVVGSIASNDADIEGEGSEDEGRQMQSP